MNTLKSLPGRIVRLVDGASRGQGLAEYALILALIAIIAIVALIFLGGQVSTILSKVGKSI
jgi:Flp pilus assembly pilin Flp